jgi:hypothetical protein
VQCVAKVSVRSMSGPCVYSMLLESVWGGMQDPSVCNVMLRCL